MINSTITVGTTTYTTVTVTGSGPFSINAVIPSGNTFSGWTFTGSGTISGTSSASLTVNSDMTVTANYTPNPPIYYNVTMVHSSITVNGIQESNQTVSVIGGDYVINAEIRPGYTFDSWRIDGPGKITVTDNSVTLTVTDDVTITAIYYLTLYTVTMETDGTIDAEAQIYFDDQWKNNATVPNDIYPIRAIVPITHTFSGWIITSGSGGSIDVSINPETTLTVNGSSLTVQATFAVIPPQPMIIKLRIDPTDYPDGAQFDMPIMFGDTTQSVSVDWGDGNVINGYNSTNLPTHIYNPRTLTEYTVTISGTAKGFSPIHEFYIGSDIITEVVQWGTLGMTIFSYAFNYARILTKVPSTFVPNVTDVRYMFTNCKKLNCDISLWDVSIVTNMSGMFSGTDEFNSQLNNWTVDNVTDMSFMFNYAYAFNQNIGGWDVSKVTNMSFMFSGAEIFNQDIGGWDVSKVTNMSFMFQLTNNFNQPLNWNNGMGVGNVIYMSYMFNQAYAFDQDISLWDVSKVENMNNMFSGNSYYPDRLTPFNKNISGWNIGLVEDATDMFNTSTMCDHHDYWPAFGSVVSGHETNFGCSVPPPL